MIPKIVIEFKHIIKPILEEVKINRNVFENHIGNAFEFIAARIKSIKLTKKTIMSLFF